MLDTLREFFSDVSIIDFLYLVITILSLIQCYKKGFILSILSMAKWILAYVITLILFPKVKPYLKDILAIRRVLVVPTFPNGTPAVIIILSPFFKIFRFLATLQALSTISVEEEISYTTSIKVPHVKAF